MTQNGKLLPDLVTLNKTHLEVFLNSDERLLEGVEAGGVEHLLLDAGRVRAPEKRPQSLNEGQDNQTRMTRSKLFLYILLSNKDVKNPQMVKISKNFHRSTEPGSAVIKTTLR